MKERSADQTAITVSLPKAVLAQIDDRAKELNVPRSRYLVWLAQHDLAKGGDLAIPVLKPVPQPAPPEPPLPPDDPEELAKFLKFAIPALEAFSRNLGNPTGIEAIVAPSETETDAAVWEFFHTELEELLKLKWLESQKAGHDLGWERAIQIWMQQHRAAWIQAHPPRLPAP